MYQLLALQIEIQILKESKQKEEQLHFSETNNNIQVEKNNKGYLIASTSEIKFQRWYISIKFVINKEIYLDIIALLDSRANHNCILEGLFLHNIMKELKKNYMEQVGND